MCVYTHTHFSFGKHWGLCRGMGWITGRSRGKEWEQLDDTLTLQLLRLPAPGDKVPSSVTHQRDFAESTGPIFQKPHFHSYSSSNKHVSHSVMSDSLRPHELQPAKLFSPWHSPGKNPGVGCHSLLQGIFLTQGLNPGLLHCRQILDHLSHQGSPPMLGFQMQHLHD